MRTRSLFVLLLLMPCGAVGAQDGPSFDCAKAGSTAEKLICSEPGLAKLDRLLAARFAAAVDVVKHLDAGAKDAERELRAYQRGWVKGRDDCWKADDPKACVEAEYLRREGDLVARYMLDKPQSVTAWQCDGNPANEIVTYLFDTTQPSVRIEYGDTIDTGSLTDAARYDASFGRWIEIDGKTARASMTDGTVMECVAAN
ncbi:MAG: hypothetical protein KDJ77_09995 [Rhodobiaceae bacterium]|nr:hypothetical protein [Rhodobiaceae bacterium]